MGHSHFTGCRIDSSKKNGLSNSYKSTLQALLQALLRALNPPLKLLPTTLTSAKSR